MLSPCGTYAGSGEEIPTRWSGLAISSADDPARRRGISTQRAFYVPCGGAQINTVRGRLPHYRRFIASSRKRRGGSTTRPRRGEGAEPHEVAIAMASPAFLLRRR